MGIKQPAPSFAGGNVVGGGSTTVPGIVTANGNGIIRAAAVPVPDVNYFGYKNLNAGSWSAGVATLTTLGSGGGNHNLAVGNLVIVASVTPSGYNGTFRVTAVPSATTFSYILATNPGTYTSGGFMHVQPDVNLAPNMPAVPAMIIRNHSQSVPLALDPDLPILAIVNGTYHTSSWSVSADGHSMLIYAGGNPKQFSNGFLDYYSGEHKIGWTSGSASSPLTPANIDTGISRNAAGVLEVNNGTAGTFRDLRIRALNIGGVQVVGAQGAAVADATDATSVIARLNELLARLRTHGLIAT